MQDWLAARAQASPEATALIVGNQQWSYAELNQLVRHTVVHLAASGIRPGEIVAVLLRNSLEYVCLIHGLARLGAILLPLNTRLTSPELEWQLEQIGCFRLFYEEATAVTAERLAGRDLDLVELETWWHRLSLPKLVEPAPPVPFSLDKLQAVVFTSGTSGRPKGAMLTYGNHFWSATASAFRLGLMTEDRWLSCLPLYHVGGLAVILRSCLYGTTVVLQEGFHLSQVNQALTEHSITLISLVPTMLHRLLDSRPAADWPDSLRLILLGGAAASSELVARSQQQALPIATTYGLTEAASQVATMLPTGVRCKPGSLGRPLMFTSVRIADDNGQTVPPGEYGEVVVSGPTVMSGYYNDAAATSRALRQGELFTGDVGYLDEEGDLWLVQRRSDIIISGGENVYPAEVETVLRNHPAVAAACVVGIKHAEWGQQVVAMIVRCVGQTVDAIELIQFCRARLAGYKLPRQIQFVDHIPQTSSGKIHRQAVVELMSGTT
jgi:O-succinylbenzoic acid--CoA ligase